MGEPAEAAEHAQAVQRFAEKRPQPPDKPLRGTQRAFFPQVADVYARDEDGRRGNERPEDVEGDHGGQPPERIDRGSHGGAEDAREGQHAA